MKNAIINRIKEKIELNEIDYADSYIVVKRQESLEKPDETEITKAKTLMSEAEARITWLKELLAKESSE